MVEREFYFIESQHDPYFRSVRCRQWADIRLSGRGPSRIDSDIDSRAGACKALFYLHRSSIEHWRDRASAALARSAKKRINAGYAGIILLCNKQEARKFAFLQAALPVRPMPPGPPCNGDIGPAQAAQSMSISHHRRAFSHPKCAAPHQLRDVWRGVKIYDFNCCFPRSNALAEIDTAPFDMV